MRSELAIQRKLDAIASPLLDERHGRSSVDTGSGLEEAIGLHDEI
jgi:hypothetical protein